MSDNPFERYGLNPLASVAELTERLRELAEDADEAGKQALREAWDELSRHPDRRLEHALTTFVDPDPPAVVAPPRAPPQSIVEPPLCEAPLSTAFDAMFPTPPTEPSLYSSLLDDPFFKDEHR